MVRIFCYSLLFIFCIMWAVFTFLGKTSVSSFIGGLLILSLAMNYANYLLNSVVKYIEKNEENK